MNVCISPDWASWFGLAEHILLHIYISVYYQPKSNLKNNNATCHYNWVCNEIRFGVSHRASRCRRSICCARSSRVVRIWRLRFRRVKTFNGPVNIACSNILTSMLNILLKTHVLTHTHTHAQRFTGTFVAADRIAPIDVRRSLTSRRTHRSYDRAYHRNPIAICSSTTFEVEAAIISI